MVRALVLSLALLATGCASTPGAQPHARIAEDVQLTLPLPPAYPETRTIVQTARAHYGDRQGALEAVVSLSPTRVVIVLTALSGPRLATITWDAKGVRAERALIAPEGVPVENILADIFVTVWPAEAVAAALPEGVTLSVVEGARSIRRGDQLIVEVIPDATDPARTLVRNRAFGYELTIVSQTVP